MVQRLVANKNKRIESTGRLSRLSQVRGARLTEEHICKSGVRMLTWARDCKPLGASSNRIIVKVPSEFYTSDINDWPPINKSFASYRWLFPSTLSYEIEGARFLLFLSFFRNLILGWALYLLFFCSQIHHLSHCCYITN